MKLTRKLSDGILSCGRCGVEPRLAADFFGFYRFFCPACGMTEGGETVADGIVAWNKFTAKFHPEPEDYLELLMESHEAVPNNILTVNPNGKDRYLQHVRLLLQLIREHCDD